MDITVVFLIVLAIIVLALIVLNAFLLLYFYNTNKKFDLILEKGKIKGEVDSSLFMY